ncbi:MAG: two-component system, OmpR family, sensor kinase [Pseudonocardiales bacterium]|nr:two-component system, OmpR family, sensor kinase [Pseudonocardiales bacterium]
MDSQPPVEFLPATSGEAYIPPPPFAAPPFAPPGPVPPPLPGSHDELLGEKPSGARSSRPRRWRLAPRSLTGRLVAGVVSLVVVLVLATGVGTYYSLSSFLYNRLDQQVSDAAGQPLNKLFQTGAAGGNASLAAPQKVWAVALTTSGAVLTQPTTGTAEPLKLSNTDRQFLATHLNTIATVHTTDGQDLRVTAQTAFANTSTQQIPAIAVIGLSTSEVQNTLNRLLELELAIGATAVVLALGATTYGVRFSLRRLYGVTRTAREVAAELSPEGAGLDRRVEVHEPDTEVGQLAESMNTLLAAVETQFAARLENENRMRQFLADASHELRTPLTSIRGYAELARMQRQHGSESEDNLSRIESEGTRMSRLVDDLLTLARSDQGGAEPRRERVDLDELVQDVVGAVRAAHPQRQITAELPPGLSVVGDRDQLVRVVRNLTTNAAVHTAASGPIRVTASAEGTDVVLRVIDAGPGLPPDEAAHVFERFWRADRARTRARGGSGLGLAIVASLVHAHGGSVDFRSTVEGGSTVSVRLPRGTG